MARTKSDSAAPSEGSGKQKKPKKQRWYHQVWSAFQMTRKQDPTAAWIIGGVFVGILAVALVIVLLLDIPTGFRIFYWLILGLPFALLGAMFTLTRKAERAAYTQIAGQPGAARAALGTVRGGWTFEDEPVAVNPRTQDFVFRGIGRPGVVLVSEGPPQRATRMLEDERRKISRVVPNVPITLIQCGDGEGQTPLPKVARRVQKLKRKLTKPEADQVNKRLKALGGTRLPIPKGVDPMKARPDRKGMRGR